MLERQLSAKLSEGPSPSCFWPRILKDPQAGQTPTHPGMRSRARASWALLHCRSWAKFGSSRILFCHLATALRDRHYDSLLQMGKLRHTGIKECGQRTDKRWSMDLELVLPRCVPGFLLSTPTRHLQEAFLECTASLRRLPSWGSYSHHISASTHSPSPLLMSTAPSVFI